MTYDTGGLTDLPGANEPDASFGTGCAFTVLHELVHQTGVLGADSGWGIAPGTNQQNSWLVLGMKRP